MYDPRLRKLADVLVNYSAGVKNGDLLRITGAPVSAPLVTEIFARAIEAGANPYVRMAPDPLTEIFLKTASDDQLEFVNPVNKFEVETFDCSIGIWADENTKSLTHCDPKRMGLSQAARKPIFEIFMRPCRRQALALVRHAISDAGFGAGRGDEPGGI